MASLQAPEDGYDFVVKPSEDFFCPVTFDLLREPCLTPCCGNHLSQGAVTRLQGKPCPVCKEPNLNPVYDKFFKRQVNKHKVRCPNKSLGCEWVGEVGSLSIHLSQNSVEGECQFETVACPYSCGDDLQRCQLERHKSNDCPNRPFTCQYCDHEATYILVTTEHLPICTKYPVECPNKSLGCQWAGERGDLDQHLNESSVEGECQFTMVACPYTCGKEFKRCEIKDKIIDCPSRPFTCQYCDYEATYTEVTTEHWLLCEKYPLQCPNECGGDMIERHDLEEHLNEVCPLEMTMCEFSYAGCGDICQRQQMQDHVNNSVKVHLLLVSRTVEEKNEKIEAQDERIEKLQSTVKKQHKQIVALMSALSQLAQDVRKPLAPVLTFIPPPDMVMVDFEKYKTTGNTWFSPPFYSHIGGYKMCLRVNAPSKGTRISVYVHMMRREHDDQLKWPFRGEIIIQLLNQERDEGHLERTLSFDDRTEDRSSGRVVGRERGSGWGYQQFTRTDHELFTNFCKNDRIIFRISEATVNSV